MIPILSNIYFQFFIIPVLTSGLVIFVKIVSRNDRYYAFRKEDLAIGLEIAVSALLILVSDTLKFLSNKATIVNLKYNEKLLAMPWVLLAFCIGIWGVSTIIRKMGWESEETLHIWWGIIFPNIFGLASLIFVVNWISS